MIHLRSFLLFLFWSIAAPASVAAQTSGPASVADVSGSNIAGAGRRIPDSIMFTIDELNEIQSRLQSGATVEEEREAAKSFQADALFLGSILYFSPTEWTVWVNGQPIGPRSEFESFEITEITPQYVQFLVPLSAQGMRPIKLEPNQTFVVASGVVIEGPWP